VAALGETTGERALRGMRERMQASPSGRVILQERPRVTVRQQQPNSHPQKIACLD
jgi:hypothetical protein